MCAVALWCSAQAQRPALEFNGEGKFKIAQFTDVHLDLGNPYRQAQAEKTIAQMRYILDAERPDLVVFTGDVVTGKPAAEGWKRVLAPVAERNLPFCWATTTPNRIFRAPESAASSLRMPGRSTR